MAKPIYYYGIHAVAALLQYRPEAARALFLQQTHQNTDRGAKQEDNQIEQIKALAEQMGVSIQYAQKDKLTALCHSPQHQGVIVQATPLAFTDESILSSLSQQDECLLLILDQVTDAHNLGACLRTAVAMGVDAVICPKHHSASLTATVAKVSVGAMEIIPVVVVTNLARCIEQLKTAGVFVFGTAVDASAKPLSTCDFTGKVALIMGSEGEGMRRLTAEKCDQLVYIPMCGHRHGSLQSLNVSVATGMALYEINRQRQSV